MKKGVIYMQVNNNCQPNYQPNFKKVTIMKRLQNAMDSNAINGKRRKFLDEFIKTYKDSKVTIIMDKADQYGKRLDAQIYYGKPATKEGDETFRMYEENIWSYTFGIRPENFFEKVGKYIDRIEIKYELPRSSK